MSDHGLIIWYEVVSLFVDSHLSFPPFGLWGAGIETGLPVLINGCTESEAVRERERVGEVREGVAQSSAKGKCFEQLKISTQKDVVDYKSV